MKRILSIIFLVGMFLFTGCDALMNSPTKEVEKFLNMYKTLDNSVTTQLDATLAANTELTTAQKGIYRDLMKKQYQNMAYKIKDETIDGSSAAVEVEVEVYDYASIISTSKTYSTSHQDEFQKEDKTFDTEKYNDYELESLGKAKEKVKYTLTLTLTKENRKWVLDDITEIERQKIHGLYAY